MSGNLARAPEGRIPQDEDEARRFFEGRSDWEFNRWEDHCGNPDCRECNSDIPMGDKRLAAERAAFAASILWPGDLK